METDIDFHLRQDTSSTLMRAKNNHASHGFNSTFCNVLISAKRKCINYKVIKLVIVSLEMISCVAAFAILLTWEKCEHCMSRYLLSCEYTGEQIM